MVTVQTNSFWWILSRTSCKFSKSSDRFVPSFASRRDQVVKGVGKE
jgi:hypothetical protein